MATAVTACVTLLVAALLWLHLLSATDRRQSAPRPVESARGALIAEYLRQEKAAFWLLWLAVAVGIGLGAALIARVLMQKAIDATLLTSAIEIATDVWLGRRAWQLYQAANRRLDRLFVAGRKEASAGQ